MKKKSNIYFYLKVKSFIRKRRKSNRKVTKLNIKRNNRKLENSIRGIKKAGFNRPNINPVKIKKINIDIGDSLSIFHDTGNVIRIVNLLENRSVSNKGVIKNLHLDLQKINEVDIGALSFLLAKVNEINKNRKVIISGLLPINPLCKNYIKESGFLDYMIDLAGNKFERRSPNFILRIGGKYTDNEKVGILIKKSIKTILGYESHYEPVFSIVQEMCGNSVEHANRKYKNWLFAVSFELDENGVTQNIIYTMTDVGYGILSTINKKWKVILEKLKLNKNTDILLRAFERKYGSSTDEPNRNRGLPLIKHRFEKNQILDLKVITNDVFLDFANHENSKVLKSDLTGTFYYWKINKDCIDKWKKKT